MNLDFHYISPNDIIRDHGLRGPGRDVSGGYVPVSESEMELHLKALGDRRYLRAIVNLLSEFQDDDGWKPMMWRSLQKSVKRANFQVLGVCSQFGLVDGVWNQYTPCFHEGFPQHRPPTWLMPFLPEDEMWQSGGVETQWYRITEDGKDLLNRNQEVVT